MDGDVIDSRKKITNYGYNIARYSQFIDSGRIISSHGRGVYTICRKSGLIHAETAITVLPCNEVQLVM